MAFSINEFIGNGLIRGGARPNLYQVELFFPQIINTAVNAGIGLPNQDAGRKAVFTCMAASLPGAIIDKVNVPYFGRIIKFKGDRQYRDWNITVFNDEDFKVRDAFEEWQNTMNYPEENVMDPAYSVGQLYKTRCQITQFAKDGIPSGTGSAGIKTYTMVGTWPVDVSDIQVSWGDRSSIETFNVTLSYDYWVEGDYGSEVAYPGPLNT